MSSESSSVVFIVGESFKRPSVKVDNAPLKEISAIVDGGTLTRRSVRADHKL